MRNITDRRTVRIVAIAMTCACLGLGAPAETITREARIPVLTVRQDGQTSVIPVRMRYTRNTGSTEPLTISISEQLPMASGNALRASIWQAAMVAALERQDPMQGVSLHFAVPGRHVDGPSAGCAFALAILSARDGREYPTNVAVTGSILPDGTVGMVGGVHRKLMAAHTAGLGSFMAPDYLRIEAAVVQDTTVEVDIKRLAGLVGMRYLPVSEISDAYALLHGLKPPPNRTEDRVNLPLALDVFFYDRYERDSRLLLSKLLEQPGTSETNAPPDAAGSTEPPPDDAEAEAGDEQEPYGLADFRRAVQAADMGYFDSAAMFAQDAFHKTIAFEQTKVALEDDNLVVEDRVRDRLSRAIKPLDIARSLKSAGLSNGGVQFLGNIALGLAYADHIQVAGIMSSRIADYIEEAEKAPQPDKENIEQAWVDLVYKASQRIFMAENMESFYSQYATNILALDAAINHPSNYRFEAEAGAANLFYAAYSASRATFTETLNQRFEDEDLDARQAYAWLMVQHPESVAAFGGHNEAMRELLDADGETGPESAYLETVLSLSCIGSIIQSSRLIMARFELAPSLDVEGNIISYGRTGMLHHLLRNARRRALDAVLECRDRGYPWIQAAMHLREADIMRDDPAKDKTEVLAKYWEASMLANALMMMLKPEGEAIPSQVPMAAGSRVKELGPDLQPSLSALQPGDIITHAGGFRVRDINELRFVVASMPVRREYEVKYWSAAERKPATATATGGSMMGIIVETFTMPPKPPAR